MLQLGVAKGRGGETCLVAAIVFLLLNFFNQCVGAINSGCWVGRLRISFTMDDGADGTVELLQSGWCRTTGDATGCFMSTERQSIVLCVGGLFVLN